MHATSRGRHFEEFTVGERYVTLGRTITETDVVSFAALTGYYNPLHVDTEFGKRTQFGERIAHGMLGASYAVGQIAALGLTEGTVIAIVHMTWDFTAPIKIGDTIHVEQTVTSVRETRKRDRRDRRLRRQADQPARRGGPDRRADPSGGPKAGPDVVRRIRAASGRRRVEGRGRQVPASREVGTRPPGGPEARATFCC
jgi:acyl dehydratase